MLQIVYLYVSPLAQSLREESYYCVPRFLFIISLHVMNKYVYIMNTEQTSENIFAIIFIPWKMNIFLKPWIAKCANSLLLKSYYYNG